MLNCNVCLKIIPSQLHMFKALMQWKFTCKLYNTNRVMIDQFHKLNLEVLKYKFRCTTA